ALAQSTASLTLKQVEVIESGKTTAKASLAHCKELPPFKKRGDAILDDALERADEDAGDGDDAVGRRVTACTLLEQAERASLPPSRRKHHASKTRQKAE